MLCSLVESKPIHDTRDQIHSCGSHTRICIANLKFPLIKLCRLLPAKDDEPAAGAESIFPFTSIPISSSTWFMIWWDKFGKHFLIIDQQNTPREITYVLICRYDRHYQIFGYSLLVTCNCYFWKWLDWRIDWEYCLWYNKFFDAKHKASLAKSKILGT